MSEEWNLEFGFLHQGVRTNKIKGRKESADEEIGTTPWKRHACTVLFASFNQNPRVALVRSRNVVWQVILGELQTSVMEQGLDERNGHLENGKFEIVLAAQERRNQFGKHFSVKGEDKRPSHRFLPSGGSMSTAYRKAASTSPREWITIVSDTRLTLGDQERHCSVSPPFLVVRLFLSLSSSSSHRELKRSFEVALPYFIYAKRKNDRKARERHQRQVMMTTTTNLTPSSSSSIKTS